MARREHLGLEQAGDLERRIRSAVTAARKRFSKDDSRYVKANECASLARDHLQLALGFVARAERECTREPDAVDDGTHATVGVVTRG